MNPSPFRSTANSAASLKPDEDEPETAALRLIMSTCDMIPSPFVSPKSMIVYAAMGNPVLSLIRVTVVPVPIEPVDVEMTMCPLPSTQRNMLISYASEMPTFRP